MNRPSDKRPKAVLVGVQLPDVSDEDFAASLDELARLVKTLGYEPTGRVTQRREQLANAAVLGEGKLVELAEWTGGDGVLVGGAKINKSKARLRFDGADDERDHDDEPPDEEAPEESQDTVKLVAVDHELTPSQARNLERAVGATVLDRSGVIVEIFHRHARSREARLQVEIARLKYIVPRLREGSGGDRQRGGVGGKGAGETSLELDRRRVRDRIAELERELTLVHREAQTRRDRRKDARRVALVGYTNAGKSSLMRALTGSEVLVEDKLFATLDTTVRALQPECQPRVLVSDTVGFIDKLPHDLVASFRSTLDEAREASLLLFVVDASDPRFRTQLRVTKTVLDEIGALDSPSRVFFNKCDQLTRDQVYELRSEFADGIFGSAHKPEDVTALRSTLIDYFDQSLVALELQTTHARSGALLARMHAVGRVTHEEWTDEGLTAKGRFLAEDIATLRAMA
ncbi:MAG: GTPase HflX [Deltaproteobacteria bacterium]|nr:GTPase HflX [Deltaproteobacteria bacterium]